MQFLQIAKHAPESCPFYNKKNGKEAMVWMENIEKVAAKYGVKIVGMWHDHPEHTAYIVLDAPNM